MRFFLFAASVLAGDAFQLNALFSDNMVLQSGDERAAVYGTGAPHENVTIARSFPSGTSDRFSVSVGSDASFYTALPMPAPGESLTSITLRVSNTTHAVTISNVTYGEVILCSGQSNMFLSVSATFDANTTMAGSYPNIRLFAVTTANASTPQSDFVPNPTHNVDV